MIRSVLAMVLVAAWTGCWGGDSDKGDGHGALCANKCTSSATCDPGEVCEDGCCVPFAGCTPGSCGAGMFCDDDDFQCKTVAEKCAEAIQGCVCHIVNSAGSFEANDDPDNGGSLAMMALPTGASRSIQAVLAAMPSGTLLPGATFTFSVGEPSPASFILDDSGTVTATAVAGEAVLTASAGGHAACEAKLVNLGPAPADGNLRLLVLDAATGKAIDGARVIVDVNDDGDDGDDDGGGVSTDANGIALTTTLGGASGTYNVTVFKRGYNYLSVVGLRFGQGADLAIPLLARGEEPETGGFTGKIDFDQYEQQVLHGAGKSIRAGLVSSSIPLQSILNFSMDLFVGPITDADCGTDPRPVGCYDISMAGLIDTRMALPGGVVLEFGDNAFKSHFDVVGQPGRRHAWGISAEADLGDIAGLFNVLRPMLVECACDVTEDHCDQDSGGDCSCDTDCGLDLDFGTIFDTVVPLLPSVALGTAGNLPLPAVSMTEWESHITPDYGLRSSDSRFPLLDSGEGGRGKLLARSLLNRFTEFSVPDLPADPEASERKLEAMVLLSGVNNPGFGFVPHGLGLGLDCTEGDCLDPTAGGFDGVINAGYMCAYEPCASGIPTQTQDGHVGVFRTDAATSLRDGEWLTLAVAFPVSALFDDTRFRATAYLVHGEPTPGVSSQLDSGGFPPFPQQPAGVQDRRYDVPSIDGLDLHWITVATATQPGVATTRWNVYAAGDGTFRAPLIPDDASGPLPDPFAAATSPDGDIPVGHINVTHAGVDLAAGRTLQTLTNNDGTTLSDVVAALEGFSVRSANLPATAR